MTKEQVVINMKAKAYLTSTDWYIARQIETGKPVPEEIILKRQQARDSIVE